MVLPPQQTQRINTLGDSFVKPYSISSVSADDPSDRFLPVRSCGLSDNVAFSISKKVQFDALDKVLPVLSLLKDYSFNEAHLVCLIDCCPHILLMDVKKTLKPKLELLSGIGLTETAFPEILSARSVLLRYNVENQLLPNAELLKSILKTNENLVDALKHSPWMITFTAASSFFPRLMLCAHHGQLSLGGDGSGGRCP